MVSTPPAAVIMAIAAVTSLNPLAHITRFLTVREIKYVACLSNSSIFLCQTHSKIWFNCISEIHN